MGACVSSIHHKASPLKAQKSFDSTTKPDHKVVILPSPVIEKFPIMNGHVAVKPQLPPSQSTPPSSDYGSKEQTFFDSQAWLDSDYEDDFMSVNGEFTPSRGNTPVHHNSTLATKQVGPEATLMDQKDPIGATREPSPTPSEKKMRLMDLFKESVREDHSYNEETIEPIKKDGLKSKSEKPVGSLHGCFANLLYVRGSARQKSKKGWIPSLSVGRKAVVG